MAAHIRPRYESALRACNAVDFDDLILLTLRLFQEHPEALQTCREKYRFVMVNSESMSFTQAPSLHLHNNFTKVF